MDSTSILEVRGLFDFLPNIMIYLTSNEVCQLRATCKTLKNWTDYYQDQVEKELKNYIRKKHDQLIIAFNMQFQHFSTLVIDHFLTSIDMKGNKLPHLKSLALTLKKFELITHHEWLKSYDDDFHLLYLCIGSHHRTSTRLGRLQT